MTKGRKVEKIKTLFNRSIASLTSHELFAAAVALFLVDHTGLYFGAQNQWWRIFRACAFIWFFPAGYNSGQKGGINIWMGMLILAVVDKQIGLGLFPLNALATILFIKYTVDAVMHVALRGKTTFWLTNALLLALFPLSDHVTEYGTMALLMGMAGWLLRHQHDDKVREIVDVRMYLALIATVYVVAEQIAFQFSAPQLAFVIASTAWVTAAMYNFKTLVMNSLARKPHDAISRACRFLGHKTLEIYVTSYLILKSFLLYALIHG
jgi:hypothetical protein